MDDKYQRPLVTCQFNGQIGNQLFIIAATLGYAWDYNATPIFPGLNTEKNRTSYNKNRLFFRLNDSASPRPFLHRFRERLWYCWEKIPFQPDLFLDGYFQSWKYFHHHRNQILSVFAPSQFTINYIRNKYGELIDQPNTVAVHVRTAGKRLHETRLQPFLGLNYYDSAMNRFPADSIFVVFSDRINWCKKHFPSLNRHFVFIEDNYGIEDLFLMSMMRHTIIGNSTFSWWGAYLNQHPDQIVIAPGFWCGDPLPSHTRDLFLPTWSVMPVPPFGPYPPDMYDYGETQSCDGNW
jgi:hypothetical protein